MTLIFRHSHAYINNLRFIVNSLDFIINRVTFRIELQFWRSFCCFLNRFFVNFLFLFYSVWAKPLAKKIVVHLNLFILVRVCAFACVCVRAIQRRIGFITNINSI